MGHAKSVAPRVILGIFFLDFLTLQDITERLSRNVGKLLPHRNMPEERRCLLYISIILTICRVFYESVSYVNV
jgi:hypothetical protein